MTAKGYGSLLVFEGADGVGKSALAKLVFETLLRNSKHCEFLAFPGREAGTLGRLVYDLHHAPHQVGVGALTATALQAAHVAAHVDAIESRILPALRAGKTVILDRYWWSTRIYGVAGGANEAVIRELIRAELTSWQGVVPSAVFLIKRRSPLRDEPMPEWRRWSRAYNELAGAEAKRYPVLSIANNGRIEDAVKRILGAANRIRVAPMTLDSKDRVSRRPTPMVFTKLSPAKPTIVYDTYWRFARDRQEIFFKRLNGSPPPWTEDAILREFKFTNAYRASDRVSQFLIQRVIYEGEQSLEEVFFRTILFKLFNKIETWNLLMSELGRIAYADYSYERYDRVLTEALSKGVKIYSGAYIMPSGGKLFPTKRKHSAHLQILEGIMKDKVAFRIASARSMEVVFQILRSYPTIGDFLAYQFATDLNYSELTNFSEMDFVMPGPGALNGIRKCFSSLGDLSEIDVIKIVADRQEEEFRRVGLNFRTLWGRPLQLIDCQNLFCEVDKYSRVRHPEFSGVTERTRIKQRFRFVPAPIRYWYPPKWGLNDQIPESIVSQHELLF